MDVREVKFPQLSNTPQGPSSVSWVAESAANHDEWLNERARRAWDRRPEFYRDGQPAARQGTTSAAIRSVP